MKFKKFDVATALLVLLFLLMFGHAHSPRLYLQYICIFALLLVELTQIAYIGVIKQKKTEKTLFKYVVWYFLFTILCYFGISRAILVEVAKENFAFIWKNLVIIIGVLFWYWQNHDFHRLLNIYLIGTAYMCIRVLTGFLINYSMDETLVMVGIHFNNVALITSFSAIISFYLAYFEKRRKSYLLFVLYLTTILMLSSRKSLVIMVLGLGCLLLFTGNIKCRLKNILILVFICVVGGVTIFSVPGLFDRFGNRLLEIFKYFNGQKSEDISIIERSFYAKTANMLFWEKPLYGNGLMSCYSYLYASGSRHVAYAHNNFLEILSSLGLIGLLIFYWIYLYEIYKGYIKYKKLRLKEQTVWLILIICFLVIQLGQVVYYYNYLIVTFLIIGLGIDQVQKGERINDEKKCK